MQEHDLARRPEWVQNVVSALVEGQAWAAGHRADTALMLSKRGPHKYTPHEDKVLQNVLAPAPEAWARYTESGIIRHPEWHQRRIDFQPLSLSFLHRKAGWKCSKKPSYRRA